MTFTLYYGGMSMSNELTHPHDAIIQLSQGEITQITKDAKAVVRDAVKAKDFN